MTDNLNGDAERISATNERPIVVATNDGASAINFDELLERQISDGVEYARFAFRVARQLLERNVYDDSDPSGSVNAYYFLSPRFEQTLRDQMDARSSLFDEVNE